MDDEQEITLNSRPRRMFFIDSENGAKQLLVGLERLNANDVVVVFHRGTYSKDCRAKLDSCKAKVEWISCVEPRSKNSMDFQIISELSMRFISDSFDHGFVVSRDQGYLPAVNYLAKSPQRDGCVVALSPSIDDAVSGSIAGYIRYLEDAKTLEDIREFFTLFMSKAASKKVMGILKDVLRREIKREETLDNVLSLNEGIEESSFLAVPGIGSVLAKKLEGVGISTVEELRALGSVNAWRMIRRHDASFPARWVYTFEAALRGVSAADLEEGVKLALKSEIDTTESIQAA